MRPLHAAALLGVLASACATTSTDPPQRAQLVRAISAPTRLGPPAALPDEARLVLKNIMGAHAQEMASLVSAIMTLHYDRIRSGAESVAADASLARPLTGDATELNSLLPAAFFDRQDDLRNEARQLAAAAQQLSALGVASAYGRLSETCVRCHAVYRGNP
jgi:cytochrome c556